jgi:hypothetical protein
VECEFAGETEILGGNLLQYHFVRQKSHMTQSGLEPGPPPWEADDYPPELWRVSMILVTNTRGDNVGK